jgi:hypothetical protein
MSYLTQAVMADDAYMRLRVAQSAAKNGCATDAGIDPDEWALEWRRVWAAAPGWDTSWEASTDPEKGQTAIKDLEIESKILAMMPFTHVADHAPHPKPA